MSEYTYRNGLTSADYAALANGTYSNEVRLEVMYMGVFSSGRLFLGVYLNDQKIGECSLERIPGTEGFAEAVATHSKLYNGYRNKGYGKKMYCAMFAFAKSQNWQVFSSLIRGEMTSDARRLWESLERDPKLNITKTLTNSRFRVG